MKRNLSELRKEILSKKEEISADVVAKKIIEDDLNSKLNQLNLTESEKENSIIARDLLEKAVQSAMEEGKSVLEESTTEILKMVFGDNYSVKIELVVKAGTPQANVFIQKDIQGILTDINIDNEGGGLKEILSLALFISVTKLVGGNKAPITLDEPTSAVSELKAESTAEAIKALLDYSERQALVITHERIWLPALIDKVYLVEQNQKGISSATLI
jgi:ABC-type cobalt transport system, ATPase component